MADTKLADLTADASPTGDDLIYTVNDPAGTPADRKVTLTNLAGSAPFTDLLIPKSLVTTKGDIIAASAASTVARVAVGSNGQVLTADSAETAGVKWTPGKFPNVFVSSGNYVGSPVGSGHTTSLLAQNVTTAHQNLFFVPFYFPNPTGVDRIGINVSAAADASSVLRFGIYDNTGTSGGPGALVVDAGTVAADSTGVKEATISQTLSGTFWCAMAWQAGVPTTRPTLHMMSSVSYWGAFDSTAGSTFPILNETGVTGALPASASPSWTFTNSANRSPRLMLRVV